MDVVFAICNIITVLSYGKGACDRNEGRDSIQSQVIEAYLGQHHA